MNTNTLITIFLIRKKASGDIAKNFGVSTSGETMTQRDDGHDYRDSKNKAEAYERKKVTIIWGTEAVKGIDPIEIGLNKKTYRFETEEQLKYFMMGVDEGNGWLEYEVQE